MATATELAAVAGLVAQLRPAMQAAPLKLAPRTATAARWHGTVLVKNAGMAWHYGELPAMWLARRGCCVDVCQQVFPFDMDRAQTMPLDGRWLFDSAAAAGSTWPEAVRRGRGTCLVSCDDNFWAPLDDGPAWMAPIARAQAHMLGRELAAADGVVCASPVVAALVRARFNPRVVVIPPVVPVAAELPVTAVAPRRCTRLGYAGGHTHTPDLAVLRAPMLAWLAQALARRFVLAGQAWPEWAEGHPQIERHGPGVKLPAYYRWLASLDLDAFVVPLLATEFNAGKAPLKPLEAAALGLPTIVSDVPPYAGACSESTGSIMVTDSHDPEQWLAAFDRLTEPEARATFRSRGLVWAATQTIEQTGPQWAKLWGAPVM